MRYLFVLLAALALWRGAARRHRDLAAAGMSFWLVFFAVDFVWMLGRYWPF